MYILAIDSTDNGVIDYDTFYFYTKRNGPVLETIQPNEWGSLTFPVNSNHLAGFSFKLKDVDSSLENVNLYRTAITSATLHGPKEFKDKISQRYGHLPVQDDDKALENKWITRQEYEEISERFAKWTTDVSLYIKERYDPDLLFFYYPQIDHEEHKYLLVDPKQPGYTKEKAKRYMDYITWSYQLADQALGETLENMGDKDRLILVSDHGMEPVHSMISPNNELWKAGLLQRKLNGEVDANKSKAYTVASGSIAHIYINLEGRERNGIVSKEEYPEVQKEIMNIFDDLEIKETPNLKETPYIFNNWRQNSYNENSLTKSDKIRQLLIGLKESPFEEIIAKGSKEGAKLLTHEQAGDVLLIAKEGYYIAQDEWATIEKAVDLGNHGGNPERKELRPVLFMTGNNYVKKDINEEISTLDIAPTLYELMDLDTPDFVDGKVIDSIVEAERN